MRGPSRVPLSSVLSLLFLLPIHSVDDIEAYFLAAQSVLVSSTLCTESSSARPAMSITKSKSHTELPRGSVTSGGIKSWISSSRAHLTYDARSYIEQAIKAAQADIDQRKDLDPEAVVKSFLVRRLWHYTKGSDGNLLVAESWKGDSPEPYFLCFHRRSIGSVAQAAEVPSAASSALKDAIDVIHSALTSTKASSGGYRPVRNQAERNLPLAFHVTHTTQVSHLNALPS